jgi:mRNA interferase RelE/StbE
VGSFDLEFLDLAHDEWFKLDSAVVARLRKKLERRLEEPRIESQRLHGGLAHCFKIRDDKSGNRMVYLVDDDLMVLRVVAVGKPRELEAYRIAAQRIIDD